MLWKMVGVRASKPMMKRLISAEKDKQMRRNNRLRQRRIHQTFTPPMGERKGVDAPELPPPLGGDALTDAGCLEEVVKGRNNSALERRGKEGVMRRVRRNGKRARKRSS